MHMATTTDVDRRSKFCDGLHLQFATVCNSLQQLEMLDLLSRDVCRLWTWRLIGLPRQWV